MNITVVLFDFGGVVAEEGFRNGLQEIAAKNGLPAEPFFSTADRLIAECGYLTGNAPESAYWDALRKNTGIRGDDASLRAEIMQRFTIREPVIDCVDLLREREYRVYLLSDQTNWLDEIDQTERILAHFDGIYNSFRTHMTKRDPETFPAICRLLGVHPGEALFIDDNAGHVERASRSGLQTIQYTSLREFSQKLFMATGAGCA